MQAKNFEKYLYLCMQVWCLLWLQQQDIIDSYYFCQPLYLQNTFWRDCCLFSGLCPRFCATAVPALVLCACARGLASHSLQHFFQFIKIILYPNTTFQRACGVSWVYNVLHFNKHPLSLSVAGISLISTRELHLASEEGTGSWSVRAFARAAPAQGLQPQRASPAKQVPYRRAGVPTSLRGAGSGQNKLD